MEKSGKKNPVNMGRYSKKSTDTTRTITIPIVTPWHQVINPLLCYINADIPRNGNKMVVIANTEKLKYTPFG